MSWLSSLFGGRNKSAEIQAQNAQNEAKKQADAANALMAEQMELQKGYQLDLAEEGSRVAAKEAEMRSQFRREGLFSGASFQEFGKFGGFSREGVARTPQAGGIAYGTGPMYTETVQQVEKTMGAFPSERPATGDRFFGVDYVQGLGGTGWWEPRKVPTYTPPSGTTNPFVRKPPWSK